MSFRTSSICARRLVVSVTQHPYTWISNLARCGTNSSWRPPYMHSPCLLRDFSPRRSSKILRQQIFQRNLSVLAPNCLKREFSANLTSEHKMTESAWEPHAAVPEKIKRLLQQKTPINSMLAFVQIVRLLKTQPRTGWIDKKIPRVDAESIADHMYRMSIIAMALPRSKVDVDKCVKIALVHDIAEALVGDITPNDPVKKDEKHRRELASIDYMSDLVSDYNPEFASEMKELWLDYEEIRCLEARYVKDIDKYEMIQQAWDYEQDFGLSCDLEEFYRAELAIVTEEIRALCDEVIRQRTEFVKALRN